MGAYCGQVFQYKYFEGMTKLKAPENKACPKGCGRLLVMIATIVPFELILHLIPAPQNIYLWLFMQNLCTSFLMLFVFFGLGDQIMLKLGLYDKNDGSYAAVEQPFEVDDTATSFS